MINRSKQNWTVGAAVKVGFLTLVVKAAVATPGDFLPDAYILANAAGTKLYKFVPHNGLEAISTDEARLLVADAKYQAAMLAASAIEQARACSLVSREIEGIFSGVAA